MLANSQRAKPNPFVIKKMDMENIVTRYRNHVIVDQSNTFENHKSVKVWSLCQKHLRNHSGLIYRSRYFKLLFRE